MSDWFYGKSGQQLGPVSEQSLRELVASGGLAAADLVWRQGMPSWVPAASVPGLMPAAPAYSAAAPPPIPAMPLGYAGTYGGYPPPANSAPDDPAMRWLMPVGRSGWAIAAGYLGLFSFIILPAPISLIVSIIAIRDLKRDKTKRGMPRAIFGLVMGILGTLILLTGLVVSVAAKR